MSEQPTAPARPARPAGGGSWMTRRSGPFNLPNWEWAGFGVAALIAVFFILHKKKASSQSGAKAAGVQCPQGYAPDSQGNCVPVSTSSNAVPQFVNQTYSTVNAPVQTTVNEPPEVPEPPGPAGPPGPPGPPGSTSPPPKTPPPRQPANWGFTGVNPNLTDVWNASGGAPFGPAGNYHVAANLANPFSIIPGNNRKPV